MSTASSDLFIKNALIFDGHNKDLVEGSIFIQNGVIEGVGSI
jgi:adenine deaminase